MRQKCGMPGIGRQPHFRAPGPRSHAPPYPPSTGILVGLAAIAGTCCACAEAVSSASSGPYYFAFLYFFWRQELAPFPVVLKAGWEPATRFELRHESFREILGPECISALLGGAGGRLKRAAGGGAKHADVRGAAAFRVPSSEELPGVWGLGV
jgi:hypothetical protein